MTTTSFSNHALHRREHPPTAEPVTDAHLLDQFIAQEDDDAFAELVRRHGAMVLGVCQRILHNPHDAEDCFQAAFLVLVRKATSIQPRSMVGNWLYGVAYRTALEARKMAAKRRTMESKKPAPESAVDHVDQWEELRPVLDQELNRLPDDFRAVLVLCDLEGKTRLETAQQLGLPPGTVASRLARARALLAKRLTRYSLAMSATGLAGALAKATLEPEVPAWLAESAVDAAARLTPGKEAASRGAAGFVSNRVAELADVVAQGMGLTKLKIALAGLLVLIALGIGIGTFIPPVRAGLKPDGRKMEAPEIEGVIHAIDDSAVTVHGEEDAKGFVPTHTYDLDGNVMVLISGKKAKLGDLKKKMKVTLQTTTGKPRVTGIKAVGPKLEGAVKAVDPKRHVIAVASGELSVAKDAPVVFAGKKGKLADLKNGMRVTLQMSAETDPSVVVGITAGELMKE